MDQVSGITAVVDIAVDAIRKAARLVSETGSGINGDQIKQLRAAIDQLEKTLNEKKRDLHADRS